MSTIESKTSAMSASSASVTTAAMQVRQAKKAMRKQMGAALQQLAPADVTAQSTAVTQHLLVHPVFRQAQTVSIYVSMAKGEVQTEELCRQALAQGKKLYVPRFASSSSKSTPATTAVPTMTPSKSTFDSDMRMLRVLDWHDFEAMVMNRWGIREPDERIGDAPREDALDPASGGQGLDLIVVPGVAFDMFGGRLGHGKGYYDRYITRSNAFGTQCRPPRPGPVTLALALKEQVLPSPDRVPSDEQDRRLNGTLTADGLMGQ